MSDRYFLDSNIFVYSFDPTAPAKSQQAGNLIREGLTSRNGVISFQVVQEFLTFALRRATPPMTTAHAQRYLAEILQPMLSVHSSVRLYEEALRTQERYRLSWYDSLIVAAAMEAGCSILFSEDLQDGQRFGSVRVSNPFA
jgi:predicted nucleic acid-binding protein